MNSAGCEEDSNAVWAEQKKGPGRIHGLDPKIPPWD